jgi:hypothetical protein
MTYADILKQHFPENSYQGQCFTFLHKLCQFPPVGNLIGQKIASLGRFGIPLGSLDSFKLGDIVLQKSPIFGHGSIINDIIGTKLQFTESNYYLNGLCHHTRQIDYTDPSILGVFRGQLDFPLPPRVIQVKLVQNGAVWGSMGEKFADIRSRLLVASGGKLDINIDTDYIDTQVLIVQPGYPTPYLGCDLNWYAQNILPHKKNYDVVCLLSTHDPLLGQTFGWHTSPGQLQVFSNETDTITFKDWGTVNYFIHIFLHELCHYLDEGKTDIVHQYFDDSHMPDGLFDIKGFMDTL